MNYSGKNSAIILTWILLDSHDLDNKVTVVYCKISIIFLKRIQKSSFWGKIRSCDVTILLSNNKFRLRGRVVSVLCTCSVLLSCWVFAPLCYTGLPWGTWDKTLTRHFAMQTDMCMQLQGHGGPHVW